MNRLARNFLHRLRRREAARAVAAAVDASLLLRVDHKVAPGLVVASHLPIFDVGLLSGDDDADRAMLVRLMRAKASAADVSGSKKKGRKHPPSDPSVASPVSAETARRVVRLVRETAAQLNVTDIVAVLQIAGAVREPDGGIARLRTVLQRPAPVITLLASDYGFVERVRDLLEDGILLPGRVDLGDVVRRVGMAYFDADPPPRRRAIYLDTLSRECEPSFLDRVIAKGAAAGHPFLHLSAPERWIPKRLAAASDLDITVSPIDWRILADTVNVVLGTDLAGLQIKVRYENVHPELLMPSDLALAIRPGRSVDEVFAALMRLSEVRVLEADDAAGEEGGGGSTKPKTPGEHKTSTSSSSSSNEKPFRNKDKGSGSELVEPVSWTEPEDGAKSGTEDQAKDRAAYLRVETLAGYGAARDWAVDLKADLDLWRNGKLPWSEMSTRLLLSGPPGTGKTTFAKALCNSLQIPLLVTSVSTWLEPGYLGDVVRRMRIAFEEAREKAPIILFVDEIDGIGKRRDSTRDFGDYWNSVVNRMLELVDGAVTTEGVIIVGATNRPEDIDAALLRSGRLEKQIAIPLPDVTALTGIFRHHLGKDLDGVLATAPRQLSSRKTVSTPSEQKAETETRSWPKPDTSPKPKPREIAADADGTSSPQPGRKTTAKARKARAADRRAETVRQDSSPRPDPEIVLRPLAVKALGRSGADIEQLVRQVRQAARREQRSITYPDLDTALGAGRPQRSPEHKRQIAVHEAGHAVVRHVLGEGDVEYLSIDRAFGGLTVSRLREDIDSEERLGKLLAIALAGRAAEEIVCGSVSAGSGGSADSDLARATDMALAMETRLGFAADQPLLHLDLGDPGTALGWQPDLAARVDARLEAAYAEARRLVGENRDRLDRVADALVAAGTLEGDTIADLLDEPP